MSYTFFEPSGKPYQECTNPNDPEDKSLCILVQDGSKFDGAIVRYTTFKLLEQELTGGEIACRYEYEIEVPPHAIKHKITDEEGKEFENKLGKWVIEILQKQMDKHAAKNRSTDTEKSNT
jgi:hypothetical protein